MLRSIDYILQLNKQKRRSQRYAKTVHQLLSSSTYEQRGVVRFE